HERLRGAVELPADALCLELLWVGGPRVRAGLFCARARALGLDHGPAVPTFWVDRGADRVQAVRQRRCDHRAEVVHTDRDRIRRTWGERHSAARMIEGTRDSE